MRLTLSFCASMAGESITRLWSLLSGPMERLLADSAFLPADRLARPQLAIEPSACYEKPSGDDVVASQMAGTVISSPARPRPGLHWEKSTTPLAGF